jgi:hypothetical protein
MIRSSAGCDWAAGADPPVAAVAAPVVAYWI